MKNFTILTATCEKFGDGRTNTNLVRNDALCARLNGLSLNFESVTGYYNDVFQGDSFLIFNLPLDEALALAREFDQESIITDDGLIFTDGRPAWQSIGLLYGEEARATGSYTRDSRGRCYSLRLLPPITIPPFQSAEK